MADISSNSFSLELPPCLTVKMSAPGANQQPQVFFVDTDGMIFRYLHSTAISEQEEAIVNREKMRKHKVRILSSPYILLTQSTRIIV